MLRLHWHHRPREDSSVLSSILERLQHLEEQNTANDLSGLPETTALIPSGTCATPSSHLDSDLSFNATPPVTSRVDPFRVFEDALQQMENFKLQFYSKQVIMGNIDLPTELAKKLIHSKSSVPFYCDPTSLISDQTILLGILMTYFEVSSTEDCWK